MSLDVIASAGFEVQVFRAEDLVESLDDSADLPAGKDMSYFDDLMIDKYMEIDPLLIDDLNLMGIESPILIEVEEGRLIMSDGHHRLAWALIETQPIPVVFIHWDTDILTLDKIISDGEVDYTHS